MSRGLGSLQRGVCETLAAVEGHELALRELRRRLGEPDRSNLRRAVRGLLERGLVEETQSGIPGGPSRGRRCLVLTPLGLHWVQPPPPVYFLARPSISLGARLREELRALQEAREEEERRRLETEAEATASTTTAGPGEVGHEPASGRRRPPGPTQTRVLYVLWKYADPVGGGLPVGAVKAIVGGDRSNTRRAIRTLLERKELEELEDGERVRLSRSAALRFSSSSPPTLEDPPDDERARILRAHQGNDPTRQG